MKSFVVSYLSLFDGELKMEKVLAESKYEAVCKYLLGNTSYTEADMPDTFDGVCEEVYNTDAFINCLEIEND